MTSLHTFTENLLTGGATVVPPWEVRLPDDSSALEELLRETSRIRALDAPYDAPKFDLKSALWSAQVVHWACATIVQRDEANVSLPKMLADTEPDGTKAFHHWSVDLLAAAWPQIMTRCRAISPDDPLVQSLQSIAQRWPLAAVSVVPGEKVDEKKLRVVIDNECLRQVLIDRVIKFRDQTWMELPEIAGGVREVAGHFPWLVGDML